MKRLLIFVFLGLCLIGCNGLGDTEDLVASSDGQFNTGNAKVDGFVKQLVAETYTELTLPAFTYKDIPALLAYRNATILIRRFPTNPISSFAMQECLLGVYMLWNVEAVRAERISSDRLFMGFPSQNPILAKVEKDENGREIINRQINNVTVMGEAAAAYMKWWTSGGNGTFYRLATQDPLAGTPYRWH